MQFLPGDLAQIQSEDETQRERQRRAQMLMQAGFSPAPNANPILAILGSVLSTVKGNSEFKDAEGKLSDNLKRRYEAENQAAQAKARQAQADKESERRFDLQKIEESAAATARHRAPEKVGWEERLFEQLPENMRGQAALNKFGLGPKAGPGPSESDRKIAQLRQLGATDDQIRGMLLGNQGGSAPSGYRPTADGALEPIPGGPADKPREVDTKQAAAQQAREVLQSLRAQGSAAGPLDGRLPTEGAQKFDRTVAQLVNPFQALTRIPGQGAQSDKELATLMASFPSVTNFEGVNESGIKNLESYLDKLQAGQGSQPQGAAPAQSQPTQTATGPNGQRIGLINGQWVPI